MNPNDYVLRQSIRDAEYEQDYRKWIEALPADERREVEAVGLDKPMIARHGNGSPDRDLADSPLASHNPDIAALVDHEPAGDTAPGMLDATEALRHLVADLMSDL